MSPTAEERAAQFKALIDLLHSVTPEVYSAFDITRTHYESAGTKIEVDILAPKRLKLEPTGSHPVIVRIHGGFLVTGSSLFPAWFSKWILDFAEEHSAVIVSPNYRLLPEVKGRDIMHDMANFWTWLQTGGPERHLASVGSSHVALNLSQTLLAGESAGGYLALQSVLSGLTRPKAMITLYPMIDMNASHYTKPYPKSIVGVSNYPNEAVDDFLSVTLGKPAITEADPPSRLDSAIAIVQNGRFLEAFGHDEELFVLERIEMGSLPPRQAGKPLLPPLFLLHGEDDTAVPVEGTRKLVNLLQKKHPDTKFHVSIRPGDHGFDFTASTQDGWLREGLEFVTGPWLSDKSRM
ncbi:Alpha/Beta hydrolase protein [Ilyonectria robusta]|uniref:Alpha/Beta hydrolase protein n=1 Tax=Ilyonectria robusta TaxID=1079257 RepID=UPI001E8D9992|nr:Alpha/Beta hydrolase protein [Ilyonectria robusta]KAH8669402.1 Alpha/Beta hydrolase protein [Ilyonectria robusta]